ncbi:hypothetical protein MTO96_046151 [Rhipicephalus appendiculatus]
MILSDSTSGVGDSTRRGFMKSSSACSGSILCGWSAYKYPTQMKRKRTGHVFAPTDGLSVRHARLYDWGQLLLSGVGMAVRLCAAAGIQLWPRDFPQR